MNNKLLVICGPTATGKTALAVSMAKKWNGELISADSRQVYMGMDIGTGKDLPQGSILQILQDSMSGYYEIQEIKVWGYDLVSPKEEFNISHYVEKATPIIKNIWQRKKLPILVGGTGFYIRAVVDGVETLDIPPDPKLRSRLAKLTREELYEKLYQCNKKRAMDLNESDRKNPVRLIRAIEIEEWKGQHRIKKIKTKLDADVFFIGLSAKKEFLYKRIEKRVHARIRNNSLDEVRRLLQSGITWNMKSMNTIGYKEWKGYLKREKTKDEVIHEWVYHEKQYAKRQLTWFKKEGQIHWFDISDKNFPKDIEKEVQVWHTKV